MTLSWSFSWAIVPIWETEKQVSSPLVTWGSVKFYVMNLSFKPATPYSPQCQSHSRWVHLQKRPETPPFTPNLSPHFLGQSWAFTSLHTLAQSVSHCLPAWVFGLWFHFFRFQAWKVVPLSLLFFPRIFRPWAVLHSWLLDTLPFTVSFLCPLCFLGWSPTGLEVSLVFVLFCVVLFCFGGLWVVSQKFSSVIQVSALFITRF